MSFVHGLHCMHAGRRSTRAKGTTNRKKEERCLAPSVPLQQVSRPSVPQQQFSIPSVPLQQVSMTKCSTATSFYEEVLFMNVSITRCSITTSFYYDRDPSRIVTQEKTQQSLNQNVLLNIVLSSANASMSVASPNSGKGCR